MKTFYNPGYIELKSLKNPEKLLVKEGKLLKAVPDPPEQLDEAEKDLFNEIAYYMLLKGMLYDYHIFMICRCVVGYYNVKRICEWIDDIQIPYRFSMNKEKRAFHSEMKKKLPKVTRQRDKLHSELIQAYKQLGLSKDDFELIDGEWPGDIKL